MNRDHVCVLPSGEPSGTLATCTECGSEFLRRRVVPSSVTPRPTLVWVRISEPEQQAVQHG